MRILFKFSLALRLLFHSVRLLVRLVCLYPLSALAYGKKDSRPSPDDNDLLFLIYSQVCWWGVWQRPQEVAKGMTEYHRVLYISPVQVHECLMRYPDWKFIERIDKGRGITVFSPMIFSGHYRWGLIFRINRLLILSELRWLLRKERPVIFFTNSPFVDYLVPRLRTSKVIYDVIDDFTAFDWAPQNASRMERYLLSSADIVFTGTYALYKKKKSFCKDATFIPCGVDFSRFQRPEDTNPEPEPEDIQGLPRPIIGYAGTLSERIDTSILSGLAERLPDASIVLIGPVHRSLGRPPRAHNIHYLGLKRHEELPAYLHRFDVALLPFRLTKAAMAINPVKTLEYLAAGCVVVSTAIPDVERFYADVVVIASNPEEFVEKVTFVLHTHNEERIKRGIEFARRASWQKMVDDMEQIINAHQCRGE